LASISNELLEKFIYGVQNDNALTYSIRVNNIEIFQYLTKRGVNLTLSDYNNKNVLHFAVQFSRLDFLRFIFQDFDTQYKDGLEDLLLESSSEESDNEVLEHISKCPWLLQAFKCLDKSSYREGNTPLIRACMIGDVEVVHFLLVQLELRDRYSELQSKKEQGASGYFTLKEAIEFANKENMTALLVAAKYNNFRAVKELCNRDANIYQTCNKMQNVLHYAILNENEEMIKFFIEKDEKF